MAEPLTRTEEPEVARPAPPPAAPAPRAAGRRLRLVSANLANDAADPAAFARLVADVGADVVAVQECGPAQAHVLRELLPHGEIDARLDYNGMGVVARAPLHTQRLRLPYRDAWVARLEAEIWGDRLGIGGTSGEGGAPGSAALEVVNVHLAAPHIRPVPRGLVMRRRQVLALERYLRETPVPARAMVGDFNATPLWPAYRRLTAQMADAALEVAQRRGRRRVEPTWSRWIGGPRLLRIDHGFVRGVRVDEFQVVPVIRSDHAALLLELSVEAEPALASTSPPGEPVR